MSRQSTAIMGADLSSQRSRGKIFVFIGALSHRTIV